MVIDDDIVFPKKYYVKKRRPWRELAEEEISAIFNARLLAASYDMDLQTLEEEYANSIEAPQIEDLGFKNFVELLLQVEMVDFVADEGNKVEKSPANRSIFENLVRQTVELVTHCEENGKDLRISDLRKYFRKFHMQDIPFEKFPSVTSVEQLARSLTQQKLTSGTNPLVNQDGVLRIKPRSKMNHKIAFPIKRQRLAISLTSRYQNFPGLRNCKELLHPVSLFGEVFGFDEIWVQRTEDEREIAELEKELNLRVNRSSSEVME